MGVEDLEDIKNEISDEGSSSEEEVIIRRKKSKKGKKIEPPQEIQMEHTPPTEESENYKIVDGIQPEDKSDGELEKKPNPKRYKKATKPDDKRLKQNKERTPAQKEAWAKALATRQRNREARKKEQEEQNEVVKEKIKKRVVKKAVKLKKKEIINEAILNELSEESSDEDIDIQKVKQYVKRKKEKRAVVKPRSPSPIPQRVAFSFI